nr:hypothetical protein BV87_00250 [Sphingobium yanoikuyae]
MKASTSASMANAPTTTEIGRAGRPPPGPPPPPPPIGTAIVYSPALGGPGAADYEIGAKLLVQIEAVVVTIIWASIGTAIAIFIAKAITGLRVSQEVEYEGLALGEQGDRAYNY